MNKKIFITGTGTDVGKTYITALIIKTLRDTGINAGYYKPVATGVNKRNNHIIIDDAEYVRNTAMLKVPAENMVSYAYGYAASPHLSARLENRPPCPDKILADCQKLSNQYEYLVIEGAGGLVCPLNIDGETLMLTDIIKSLDTAIIIVVPAMLGAINSAVLTSSYARENGIQVKGFILNKLKADELIYIDNKKTIEQLTGIPVLLSVEENAKSITSCDRLLAVLNI